jgi:TrmH family RNA methyltransferase
VTSRHNPIVGRFRATARGETSLLLLDGVHLIEEAVASGIAIRELAVTRDATSNASIGPLVDAARRRGTDVTIVSSTVMDALSPVRSASPIVALADRPTARVDQLFTETALLVIAVDIQDPGNLGAMVRAAEAFGASGVIVGGDSADPFGWKALRGSMGSALRLPILVSRSRTDALTEARRHGCQIVATVPRGGRPPSSLALTGPSAVLIGGEGAGLRGDVLALANERLTIPMQAPVESLNAAVTAALVLYEAARQRAQHGSSLKARE